MKSLSQRFLFWVPRILLTVLWASYIILLVRRMAHDGWNFGTAIFELTLVGLLLVGLALVIEVFTQEYQAGTMRRSVRRLLFWTPRIVVLLFAAFLSLFALDVFGEGYGFWMTLGALLIHLLPTWVLLGALVLFWRQERAAAICFLLFAAWMLTMGNVWFVTLFLAGLPLLISILFLLNWRYRVELYADRRRASTS